jgi:hypothetical protein
MNIYIDGTAIQLEIDLVNSQGIPVDATAVEYSITDGKGVEKLARQPLSDFEPGPTAVINIGSLPNTMTEIGDLNDEDTVVQVREARVVTLFLTTDDGAVVQSEIYGLERPDVLIEGYNSMLSYADSLMTALNFVGLDGWNNANKNERVSALLAAGSAIRNIVFSFDAGDMNRVSYKLQPATRLRDIGRSEYLSLDAKFREALSYAQILEANSILDTDETLELIQNGVTSVRIGETEQTFKPVKPIVEPLCKEAMVYVRPYIRTTMSVGRA